jgi:hypothetical protein
MMRSVATTKKEVNDDGQKLCGERLTLKLLRSSFRRENENPKKTEH